MKISSCWLINWLNALVQDFDEVAIVKICSLAKSSYNPGLGTNPDREGEKQSFSSSMKGEFFKRAHKHC